MKTMITRNNVPRHNGDNEMPFGPKRTAGISGHCSEAWAIAPRLGAEACGSWWKPVEAVEASGSRGRRWGVVEVIGKRVGGVGRGAGGLGEVREVQKRSGRSWEGAEEAGGLGKVTVRYS